MTGLELIFMIMVSLFVTAGIATLGAYVIMRVAEAAEKVNK